MELSQVYGYMGNNLPSVSIIIPCLNEERYIGKCLASIIENDYPKDRLEIFVVDGMSTDRTRELIGEFTKNYSFVYLLDNHKVIQSAGLNIGIRNSKGEVIIRILAHTTYPPDYISKCVKYLSEFRAAGLGGVWITLPGNDTYIANVIAIALSSSFGVGDVYHKIGVKMAKQIDSISIACYHKEVFNKIGLFDEEFVISAEDEEFNYRLRKRGGKIWLIPDIYSYYYARDSLNKLWHQYFKYGVWKIRLFQKHFNSLRIRHLIPAAFVLALACTLIIGLFYSKSLILFSCIILIYLATSLGFAFKIAKNRGWKYFFCLPLIFAILHLSHGIGFWVGFIKFARFR